MGKGSAGGGGEGAYGRRSGFIYIYNLIVGVGALALPHHFVGAGVGLSLIVITTIAAFAYMTFTWIIEVLAAANAILSVADADEEEYAVSEPALNMSVSQQDLRDLLPDENKNPRKSLVPVNKLAYTDDEGEDDVDEASTMQRTNHYEMPDQVAQNEMLTAPLVSDQVGSGEAFKIKQRIEMGFMAELFLGKLGKVIFYLVLVIYLFGDLAIYVAMVSQTLTRETPDFSLFGIDFHTPEHKDDISAKYRFWVIVFTIIVVPWAYLNLSKTKYLQRGTMFIRTCAFFTMVIIGFVHVAKDGTDFKFGDIDGWFRLSGFPSLFGALIYSFMCHHSVPAIVSPIKKKEKLSLLFFADYVLVLLSYLLLSVSAAFSFGEKVNPMYTFNFSGVFIIGKFLVLFPVFTLTLNFPLIAITLRNNLEQLLLSTCFSKPKTTVWQTILHCGCATAAAFPPIMLALATNQIDILVNFTGGYAGCFIQFIFPATLVLASRIKVKSIFGPKMNSLNAHASPFQGYVWIICVYVLGLIVLGFTTYQRVSDYTK